MLQKICHICGNDIIMDYNHTGNTTYRCHDHYVEHRWTSHIGNHIVVHKYYDYDGRKMFISINISNGQASSWLGFFDQNNTIKLDKNLIDRSNEEIFSLYEKLTLLR
jgi:hypothetical protein